MHKKLISNDIGPVFIDGKGIAVSSLTATDAKNEFGQILDMVVAGRAIVITKHEIPKAVMLSYEEFMALAERGERSLDALRAEFDELLDRMQTPEAQKGMKSLFKASPEELGAAAVSAARKPG